MRSDFHLALDIYYHYLRYFLHPVLFSRRSAQLRAHLSVYYVQN